MMLPRTSLVFSLIITVTSARTATSVGGDTNDIAYPSNDDAAPRFRVNELREPRTTDYEVYLNDRVRFQCKADGRPTPTVTWTHNGHYVDLSKRPHRYHERPMSLEIHNIEVSDQGTWECHVSNDYGTISRTFTLDIIDFCDYFLYYTLEPTRVPLECRCCWWRLNEVRRSDIDFRDLTGDKCAPFEERIRRFYRRRPFRKFPCVQPPCDEDGKPVNRSARKSHFPHGRSHAVSSPRTDALPFDSESFTDPVRLFDWLVANHFADVSHILPKLLGPNSDKIVRERLANWTSLGKLERVAMARKLMVELRESSADKKEVDDAWEDDEDDEDVELPKKQKPLYRKHQQHPDGPLFFKGTERDPEGVKNESIQNEVHPSGRTVRLSCRPGDGIEPEIVWYKDGGVLTKSYPRTGTGYKFSRYTLEMEDATTSDSGMYKCELSHDGVTIRRHYKVDIVNRLRSPPIIVPNVFVNQTVNEGEDVHFNCRIISDLTPYILWLRIRPVNGSLTYYNDTAREEMAHMFEIEDGSRTKTKMKGDSSTLTIYKVTQDDAGIYACVSGSSLGVSKALATLTIRKEEPPVAMRSGPTLERRHILLICALIIALLATALLLFYFCFRRHTSKRGRSRYDDQVVLMPKKKRVRYRLINKWLQVVVKKSRNPDDGTGGAWADIPSYHIQVIDEMVSSTSKRSRLNSERTLLSDYEVDPDPNWEVSRNRLKLVAQLGEGAFGEVWKGILRTSAKVFDKDAELPVAVKRLKASAHEKELIDLVSEMETFKIIGTHENLLKLIGCCTGAGPLYVILELCTYGNLR